MHPLPDVIFGTLREHYIMLFGAAGLFASTCGFVAGWVGARIGARSGARQALIENARANPERPDHRIDQLVVAVDAIALEVERMAEGQRFTARLLSERAAEQRAPVLPASRREAGTVTPH
jgi:hypothetical protein